MLVFWRASKAPKLASAASRWTTGSFRPAEAEHSPSPGERRPGDQRAFDTEGSMAKWPWVDTTPPILEPILVVGLGPVHWGLTVLAFDPWPNLHLPRLAKLS